MPSAFDKAMKLLICGDRNWNTEHKIRAYLMMCDRNTIIIHGAARGADFLAGKVARELEFKTILAFPANWEAFGKAAGPIRNRQMLDEKPDLVAAFHSNIRNSKGTLDCIMEANKRGIRVEIVP